jgi:[ribosomal protein S18]-alanine N-acetyltransferase
MDDPIKVSDRDLPACRLVQPDDARALGRLFERLRTQGIEKFFHPHPLTHEAAAQRANYAGKDVYCVLQSGKELTGYGMLRGWDEGYEIPSLGIAIDSAHQGQGHGRRLMEFLHDIARQRGAKQVRLRVFPENARAVALYQSLGYSFDTNREADGQILGFLDLEPRDAPPRGEQIK